MGFSNWARKEFKKGEDARYKRELKNLAEKKATATAKGQRDAAKQREDCACDVSKVRQTADKDFKAAVSTARERRREAIQPAKDRCTVDAAKIGQRTAAERKAAEERAAELRKERDMLKRAEQKPGKVRATSKERRSESDDAVLSNIEPELHALFRRVKAKIHGNERLSRTEAFLQYVEEHPSEALQALEDDAERWVKEQLKGLKKTQPAQPRRRASGERAPF